MIFNNTVFDLSPTNFVESSQNANSLIFVTWDVSSVSRKGIYG